MNQSHDAFKTLDNEDFYKADGSFDTDRAKQAYYDMMAYHNYPIVPRLKGEEFWAVDFGLGQFTEVGMAGIFWVNNQEGNYFGHEIYLLPGQMIPEHSHKRTAAAGPKMEAWQVRHGSVRIYSTGEPTPGVTERIPPIHRDIAAARTEKELLPGEVGTLNEAQAMHWMIGGPEGGIVTEYATYHDGDGLRFTHPKVSL
jgi:D-lyxose ketol-isomerase